MKTRLLMVALCAGLFVTIQPVAAAAAAASTAQADYFRVAAKVRNKIVLGVNTAGGFAAELAEFDSILAKHVGVKTDAVAQVLYMKGMLYFEVIKDPDQAVVEFRRLKAEFPATRFGRQADALIANIGRQGVALRIQKELAVGAIFPAFAVTDSTGAPLSLEQYRGKVVLIDFWAMWCGPCLDELPNVVKAYQKYHDRGFDIIGISLDLAGEGPKLARFTQDEQMPWRQFFDGGYWQNELARKYGVNSIPATYLLDGEGRIIAKNLRGPALAKAIEQALAKQ